ncbi:predicted ATPase of the PP-loop superfamily implicated in cell cycle control [Longilinea arvoryzae]|uniref:Predicted ATPase of the PP-loop superfamily implicated in cell cycle control n=1 Tax=Longilinea arvoryzae TaxID=360412 RepID=A0A0S7B9N9_9CHLR|nr:ATP-binding protein [Longilinea arvoryzae]GAP14223.1 predicted ATPase of the PP-loop superfamily implicated in cell cycle control [Longilinea arvoryzae]
MSNYVCSKCRAPAVFRMRHHRLAFCQAHYLEWFIEQTARVIEKYHMFTPQDRILVAVSGGKDSLALWDVLWRLGYPTDGLYINLGINGSDLEYSNESEHYARAFAEQNNLTLRVVNVQQSYAETIPQLASHSQRGRVKPCGVCGLVKRHIMNQVAMDNGYSLLTTAHNLDDEVAVLMGNTLTWQVDLLQRQSPVLPAEDGFVRKAKPFCRFYERETAAYTLLRGIPYEEDECPYAVGSKQLTFKDILNKLEETTPGIKMNFYASFQNARADGYFVAPGKTTDEPTAELRKCPGCGQPTTSAGLCAFCRLVKPA